VSTGIDVRGLEPDGEDIIVRSSAGEIRARFVIWAAGQFQYPNVSSLSGVEHGIHSRLVKRWPDYPGDDVLVIGGYESGIDATIGLTVAGKSVTVLSRGAPGAASGPDPSLTLSPFTKQRFDALTRRRSITLFGDADILGLERQGEVIRALGADGRSWVTKTPPVLATGFAGSTKLVSRWFAHDANDRPILTAQDESTELPGLFLVGPEVHHEGHIFCFIYKFRQRFAVVARAIAVRMGVETEPLTSYRANNMFLDDLSCCDATECLC
jgi:putative flavoprotein involved in K+ transport